MYQVPTSIWNEIAKTQKILHQPWARLFPLPSDKLLPELAKIEQKLDRDGADARVVRAYLLTAPLLTETVAISRFVEASLSNSLRSCLPELTAISEAVALATAEYRLSPKQQAQLRQLLTKAHQNSASAQNSAPLTA